MKGIEAIPYQLSDGFLKDYLEQQPIEVQNAQAEGLDTVRRKQPKHSRPKSDERADAALSQLETVQKHQSWVGLSTGPTVWSLASLYTDGSEIPRPIQALLSDYDFYMIRFGAHLDPKKGEKFIELTFHAEYSQNDCFTYDQLPSTKLETVAAAHANLEFGVQADLSFGAQVPIPLSNPTISADAKVQVKSAVDAGIILKLDFEWKVQRVVSIGPDRSEAQWRMYTKDLVGFVPLYAITRVPKAMDRMTCTIQARYTIDMPGWLAGKVEYETDLVSLQLKLSSAAQATPAAP